MTLLQKINNLTWWNEIAKLKDILKELLSKIASQEPKYKVYTALLSQSGTDAPVATVLENTLGGDIAWSRDNVGIYIGTPVGITGIFVFPKPSSIIDSIAYLRNESGVIFLETISVGTSSSDDLLLDSLIEIRVYN